MKDQVKDELEQLIETLRKAEKSLYDIEKKLHNIGMDFDLSNNVWDLISETIGDLEWYVENLENQE